MEARVAKLEDAMLDVRLTLVRIEEKINSLATKDDLHVVAKDLSLLKGEMKGTLGLWQFLGIVAILLTIVLRWPELFRVIGG
jgi:hypothetical protein